MKTWIIASIACAALVASTSIATAANVDLSIAMTDAPDPVTAGGNVSFVITVTDATAPANGVKVVDPLPAGAQLVAANGTGWVCVNAAMIVTCTHAAVVPVGPVPPITIFVQTPITGGLMTNTATVSTTDTDTNAANNSATTTTQVDTSSDLSITQTAAPSPVAAASMITYTLSANNAGPSPAAMVQVTDTLSPMVTFISATGTGWACAQAAGVVTCTQDPLAPGPAQPITVLVTAPSEPQTVTNAVAITAMTADPQLNNNTKSVDTVVVAGADLSLAMVQDRSSILVNEMVTYSITITNHGPSTADMVTVTDTLAAEIYVSASGTGWTCGNAANIVTCTATSLPPGVAPVITLVATGPGTPQKVINSASVVSPTADPSNLNNSAMIETTILGSADVGVAMTGTPRALTSSILTFTITVTNQGPSTAQSIRVIDTLPDGTTYVSAAGMHWGCRNVGQMVTCDTTDLSALGTAPNIVVTVAAPDIGTSVLNLVAVSSATHDPSMDNNTAMALSDLDQLGVRGGGCAVGGGGASLLVVVGAALLLRRRRAALVVGLVALGILGSAPAQAQVVGSSESFPVDHMRLALDPEGILAVEWAGVPNPGDWSVATFVGYQTNPLVAYNATAQGNPTVGALIKRRISGDLAIGVGITRWFEAGLELPIIYQQTRDDMAVPGVTTALKSPRAGDLRLAPKFLILRGGDGKVSVAAIAGIGIPTGGSVGYAGDGSLTVSPEAMVSFRKGGIRIGVDGGVVIRKTTQVAELAIGTEIFARIGVGYRLPMGLEFDAMLLSSTMSSKLYSQVATDPLEADAGVSYNTEGFGFFVLGGRGIHTGFGTPELRFLAGIRISPAGDNKPLDTDGDGIPDSRDKCPTQPEDKDGFQDEDGCPDPDNDKDGIADEDDKCPNDPEDKDGFQDADGCPDPDNDKDGILDATDKCPNEPEDKDGFQDADGCPDPDNDGDGILDVDDKCPNEKGPKETHGCPDTDSDADGIPDRLDTCPDDKGTEANGGCTKRQAALIRAERIELMDKVTMRGAALDPRSNTALDAVAKIMGNHAVIKVRVDGTAATLVVKYLLGKGIASDRLQANPATAGPVELVLVDKIEAPKAPDTNTEPDIDMTPDEPKPDAKKPDAKPPEPKKPDAKKPDAKKPDPKKPDKKPEDDIEMDPN